MISEDVGILGTSVEEVEATDDEVSVVASEEDVEATEDGISVDVVVASEGVGLDEVVVVVEEISLEDPAVMVVDGSGVVVSSGSMKI